VPLRRFWRSAPEPYANFQFYVRPLFSMVFAISRRKMSGGIPVAKRIPNGSTKEPQKDKTILWQK
jgi:hypothetical protein